MTLAKTRLEDRPRWERTDEDNAALFDAALDRGDAFPDPMPGATDEERRRELGRLLQEGIDELDAGLGITLSSDEEITAFFDGVMQRVARESEARRRNG